MVEPNGYRSVAFITALIFLMVASWFILGRPAPARNAVVAEPEQEDVSLMSDESLAPSGRGGLTQILSSIKPPSSISDESDEY